MPRPQNPELRDALLTAAIQLLDANGPDFSLRALADSVGYTVTAVYRCYANRSALLTAMQLELFDQLGVALFSNRFDDEQEVSIRIGMLGEQFLSWAMRHPKRYQFMFTSTDPETLLSGADRMRAQAPLQMLATLLQHGIERGELRAHDAKTTAVFLFSAIHGFASLCCAHRLDGVLDDSPEETFSNWYRPWILGLRVTP